MRPSPAHPIYSVSGDNGTSDGVRSPSSCSTEWHGNEPGRIAHLHAHQNGVLPLGLGLLSALRTSPTLATGLPPTSRMTLPRSKSCSAAGPSGSLWEAKLLLPKEKWNNAAIAEAKGEIEKHLAILDRQLAGKSYLVAEQFSLAEVCYIPFLDFLPLMEIAPQSAVAAWSGRLLARPSAVATRPGK